MLLLETPQGPSGRQRGWNPELGDLSGLPRHASSCPATPQDTLHRSRGGSHAREAFPLTDARSEQPKADTRYGTSGKMEFFYYLKPFEYTAMCALFNRDRLRCGQLKCSFDVAQWAKQA